MTQIPNNVDNVISGKPNGAQIGTSISQTPSNSSCKINNVVIDKNNSDNSNINRGNNVHKKTITQLAALTKYIFVLTGKAEAACAKTNDVKTSNIINGETLYLIAQINRLKKKEEKRTIPAKKSTKC